MEKDDVNTIFLFLLSSLQVIFLLDWMGIFEEGGQMDSSKVILSEYQRLVRRELQVHSRTWLLPSSVFCGMIRPISNMHVHCFRAKVNLIDPRKLGTIYSLDTRTSFFSPAAVRIFFGLVWICLRGKFVRRHFERVCFQWGGGTVW